jgi:hypothetical protein
MSSMSLARGGKQVRWIPLGSRADDLPLGWTARGGEAQGLVIRKRIPACMAVRAEVFVLP